MNLNYHWPHHVTVALHISLSQTQPSRRACVVSSGFPLQHFVITTADVTWQLQ